MGDTSLPPRDEEETGSQAMSESGRDLAQRLGVPYLEAADYPETQPLNGRFSVAFMKQYRFLPLFLENNVLQIVMANPADIETLDAVRMHTGYEVEPLVGEEGAVLEAIDRLYGSGATTVGKIIEDMGGEEIEIISGPAEEDEGHLRDLASEAPVIRLVNLLVNRAVEAGASDIHFEPFEERLVVRYRVDGVLHEVESPPKRLQAAIISRLKLMAKMNIAERRLPQDGRIRVRVEGRSIDIRVSTVPTVFGESLVLRLLDRSAVLITLESLGFDSKALRRFEGLVSRPYGMLLVTGPTGSGKTTTLYASLDRIKSAEKKIITIEDPVEYQIEGINQIQVMPRIGLTFANGLRSIVRQDPDVVMVGEIRDQETADIAVHAALTGHLVFSTVHTNDAAGAVARLADMGLEGFLIASSVMGILAQRLVRKVCPDCAVEKMPDPSLLGRLSGEGGFPSGDYRVGEGCGACNQTGYRGRVGIFELMVLSEQIRKLVLKQTSASAIREAAVAEGMRTLREDGIAKVRQGITTLSEVLRVTQDE
jgi:general secretion pathway protein E